MNMLFPVADPVTPLATAPAILAAANLLLPHLERGQRVDAAALRAAMEAAFGASDARARTLTDQSQDFAGVSAIFDHQHDGSQKRSLGGWGLEHNQVFKRVGHFDCLSV